MNVWSDSKSGKWIVSETMLGTNNEKVRGEFWKKEDAVTFNVASDLLSFAERVASWAQIPDHMSVTIREELIRQAGELIAKRNATN